MGQALDRYINRHAKHNLSLNVWKQYQSAFNALPPTIGAIPIHDLKPIAISDHIESLHESPTKALNLLKCIKSAFSWLHDKGYIKDNKIKGIKKPFTETKRERTLTEQELTAILQASLGMGYPYGDMTLILAYTGQRKGEVSGMRWDELDLDNALWTIPAERAKNRKEHKVPLSPTALRILKSISYQGGDYVFSTTGGNRPSAHSSKIKERIDKAVEFTNWTIHDIRRTTATNLAQQGIGDLVISTILNHSKDKMLGVTSIYNRHDYMNERTTALNNYGAYLDGLTNGTYTDKVVQLKRQS